MHGVEAGAGVAIVIEEEEDRIADHDLIAVMQATLLDRNLVDSDTIEAPGVANYEFAFALLDNAVPARNGLIGQEDLAAGITTDCDAKHP